MYLRVRRLGRKWGDILMRVNHIAIWAAALAISAGCNSELDSPDVQRVTSLRVAVLPDESIEAIRERYTPLLDHVSAYIGIPCELVVAKTYDELVDLMVGGHIDVAHFGGYSYALAHERAGTVALVQRDLDTRFTSYLVARADADADRIEDFESQRLSFGSRLSTSGHLMPRLFLSSEGITPETFFEEVVYSGAHDLTVLSVVKGEVDLGAVNAQIFESMIDDGRVNVDDIRVVAETPPYFNYVWAVHPSVPERSRIEIRDAFMSLSPTLDRHQAILSTFGAKTYLPADDADYASVREAVKLVSDY